MKYLLSARFLAPCEVYMIVMSEEVVGTWNQFLANFTPMASLNGVLVPQALHFFLT
jgi:hypothetical protein